MALIVPISTSFLAIAAGYWGLLSLVAFLGWLLVALLPQPGGLTLIFVRTGLITSAFCGAPSLLLAHFARRSLAKNASLLGRGRIRFAEFAAAAMLVTIVVAMVRQAVYVP